MKKKKHKKTQIMNKITRNSTHLGDCLELMKNVETGTVDMILCDLPYGTTACKWDSIIPFEPLWEQYKRVIKYNGAIVLTSVQPFTSALVMSNKEMYKYDWYLKKSQKDGFLNSKKQPLREYETASVFYKKQTIYNPQLIKVPPFKTKVYATGKQSGIHGKIKNILKYEIRDYKYPTNELKFNKVNNSIHPTQKPVALFEYLIKTYTNEGDLVLDNCAGSGTTGVACQNLKRDYILMEKELEYYDIINDRLKQNDKRLKEQLFV